MSKGTLSVVSLIFAIFLGIAISCLSFYLIGSYLTWDITHITRIGEWKAGVRFLYGYGVSSLAALLSILILSYLDR
jgi:hypothetical protein